MARTPAPDQPPRAPRRKPPQYAYDGLTGAWLRLPWWLHLGFAAAAWPACTYLVPRLPAHEPWVRTLLGQWVPQWGWMPLVAFCVGSALASAIKAARQPPPKAAGKRKPRRAAAGEAPRAHKPRKPRNAPPPQADTAD